MVATVKKALRIGVDVGGTNTDCIILDPSQKDAPDKGILCAVKTATTPDVTLGITEAIARALKEAEIDHQSISAVMIGTTHFVNAVIQADEVNLARVAVLRLSGPYTQEVPSFVDFPPILEQIMNGHTSYLSGGLDFDCREIYPLDEAQIRQECQIIKSKGISDIVVAGVFSPLDVKGIQEERVKKIVLQELPEADVILSRDIGQIGFLERENASILNASIIKFARRTINGFLVAMRQLGLSCPLYLTQNDGTLIDAKTAKMCPIKTFSSGPTNSMAGAAYLADLNTEGSKAQIIVADIGGTTTDFCALLPSGFPREAGAWVEVAGVRCAFPMPEVLCIGLGGGTKVVERQDGSVVVGPESVGHKLLTEALVFSGQTLTVTDIAVAAKAADIGDASLVESLSPETVEKARARIKKMLEKGVDRMKLTGDGALLIMVGGGSVIQMDSLQGVSEIIRPPHFDCANAVGAAIAKISGQVDSIEFLEGANFEDIENEVKNRAIEAAIKAGAKPETVRIASIENLPLEHSAIRATRLIVKAAGALSEDAEFTPPSVNGSSKSNALQVEAPITLERTEKKPNNAQSFMTSPSANINIAEYRPEISPDGTWFLSEIDLEFVATGSSILACGGGGPGYITFLSARNCLRQGKKIRVVSLDSLPDDCLVFATCTYGAPAVVSERLPSGTEAADAIAGLLPFFPEVKGPGAMIADEIGGMNAIRPMLTAAHFDIASIDGDYMGRAYPRIYHTTTFINGFPIQPCSQSDGLGRTVIAMGCEDPARLEKLQRKAAIELGLMSQMASCPLYVRDIRNTAVGGTTSLAWRLGKAVHQARQQNTNIVQAVLDANPCGKLLYSGKVLSVKRWVSDAGYTEGVVRLRAVADEEREFGETSMAEARDMLLPFQNEYLYAGILNTDGTEEIVATVPDLISLLGSDGFALGTQDIKYGIRVNVVAFATHPHWYTPRGLELGGPYDFGYKDMKHVSVADTWCDPVRVMEEYRPSS